MHIRSVVLTVICIITSWNTTDVQLANCICVSAVLLTAVFFQLPFRSQFTTTTTTTTTTTKIIIIIIIKRFHSVAVVLTLVQTKQIINVHKRSNTKTKQYKNTVQTIQDTVNTSTQITKTPTQLSKHPHIHKPTHYKTHIYTHWHITKQGTHYKTFIQPFIYVVLVMWPKRR